MKKEVELIEKAVRADREEKYWQRQKRNKHLVLFLILSVAIIVVLNMYLAPQWVDSLEDVPPFSGDAYVVVNRNRVNFEVSDLTTKPYVRYSELDELGRAGAVMACIGKEAMPEDNVQVPDTIIPSGWQQVSYQDIGNLYVRTELVGYQMTGAEPDARNTVTGTAMQGLKQVEDMVAAEVLRTGNHVLYRVTPVYEGDNLVASGFTVEALSVEDNGVGLSIYLYVYNAQKGVTIDYATGESMLS